MELWQLPGRFLMGSHTAAQLSPGWLWLPGPFRGLGPDVQIHTGSWFLESFLTQQKAHVDLLTKGRKPWKP